VTADPGDLLLWDSVSTFIHVPMTRKLMSIANRALWSHAKLHESPDSKL
jgi:hypothetical protein